MSRFSDAVKKINSRLETFERRGLTGTWEYNQLRAQIATAAGDNMTLDSRGYTHISGAKLSSTQKAQIMRAAGSKVTTATHAMRRLVNEYDKTYGADKTKTRMQKVREMADLEKDVHQFIIDHKQDIYKIATFSAMVRRHSNMTPEEARQLLDMYNSPEWQTHLDLVSIDSYKARNEDVLTDNEQYMLDVLDDLRAAKADQESILTDEMSTEEQRHDAEIHIQRLEEQIQQTIKTFRDNSNMG